jgi:ABC-type sugar transport system ATPase subunit
MATSAHVNKTESASVPMLAVEGLRKRFGATQALADASLELIPREIHSLVGENGSGKSTMVKILSGLYGPDGGTISLGGAPVSGFHGPDDSLRAGIATVFQEVLVVEPRSVLENIWLGSDGVFRGRASHAEQRERAKEVLGQLLESPPPLDLPVEALALSDRQACCIARALVRRPKLLILDEATSALDIATRDRLFDLLRKMTADGGSVIFISHRMDEVAEIGDRVTVMRSGSTVATLERGEASTDDLVTLMTGADHLIQENVQEAAAKRPHGDPVLRCHDIVLSPGAEPIEFEIKAGETVGLAGLEGHGQDLFLRVLAARANASGSVEIIGDGGAEPIGSPSHALECGVAYVPRERRAESLFESKSILENFSAVTMAKDRRRGLISRDNAKGRFAGFIDKLGITLGSPNDSVTTLSGGNQQKVIMARWLAIGPRVLLLNDPTRGVDLGAKRDLYRLLSGLASEGVAIVMLSTEVDEHIELMDRVLVFRDQSLSATLDSGELSRRTLVSAYFGEKTHA